MMLRKYVMHLLSIMTMATSSENDILHSLISPSQVQ